MLTPRLKNIIINKFNCEINKHPIFKHPSTNSLWWINPNTKNWIIELEPDNTIWYNSSWGESFTENLCLSHEEFISILKAYIKQITNKNVIKTYSDIILNDFKLDHTNEINHLINDIFKMNKTNYQLIINTLNYPIMEH